MRAHLPSNFPSVIQTGTVSMMHHGYLTGIIPHPCHEIVHELPAYKIVVVLYPGKDKIRGFKSIFDMIKSRYADKLLPAFYCVDNGTCSSWFAVFLRK